MNKRLAINMIATLFSFCVTMGISFILSPYIINTVGKEAYGFVGLANNFIGYAQLITLALNSMAGRFITIKIHQDDTEGVNKYFTSVMVANILMAMTLMIPAIVIVFNLNKIINVPTNILIDVQILWGFVFLNFLIGLVLTTCNIATFVTNRLDLSSIRDIQSNFIKVFILIIGFSFFTPSVWYIGFASFICTIFIGSYNIYYKQKLLPNVKIKLKYFDIKVVGELIYAGIWNVVIKLGQILSDGLDLLISNLFINPTAMGILAISKTVPGAIGSLLGTVTNVFSPQLTIYYAKNDKESLTKELIKSMKFVGVFTNIPLVFLIVFGTAFYSLWTPNEDIKLIQTLAVLNIYGSLVSGVINPLFSVFTITNKLKVHSFVIVFNGVINTMLVWFLLKNTDLGVLAIAGVSGTTATIRNLIYTPLYAARCLDIKSSTFYPSIVRYSFSSLVLIIIFFFMRYIFIVSSWLDLVFIAIICGVIGLVINLSIILTKEEKSLFLNIISSKLIKRSDNIKK